VSGTPGTSKWGDREAFPKTIFAIFATHVSIELISAESNESRSYNLTMLVEEVVVVVDFGRG